MTQPSVVAGAVWGLVAAMVMVAVMGMLGGDDPPPFAVFWSEYIGDGTPEDAMPQALAFHVFYAAAAGEIYVGVFGTVDLGLSITSLAGGIAWGLVWGVLLLVVAMVFWFNVVLDIDPDPGRVRTVVTAHVAYGLTLGVLVAAIPIAI